jgi:hypothetical protein
MAKIGNKNARTHGIYSKYITVTDDVETKEMPIDSNIHELAFSRTLLAHAQKEFRECQDPELRIKWDFACRHWTEVILGHTSINRNAPLRDQMVFETSMQVIRAIHDAKHIK